MEANFWHQKWAKGEIGFHEGEVNQLLEKHFNVLNLQPSQTVFVPLCGKTRDIAWLLKKQQNVVGVELNEEAVRQLFDELGETPEVTAVGELIRFSAPHVVVYVGDFFKLTREHVGHIDVVYDRAALVALPDSMRTIYCEHLLHVTQQAKQLLITFEYEQSRFAGPPFSISAQLVERYYANAFAIHRLESKPVKGGIRGFDALETAWSLR
ncbi:thiopurine S-methyltransferase [Pseudoalteromonas xiamenensis]|uniref:Thiopurine S-methyltransferase n=1 Tax=Pseudoalteromonas xiamenensis TaxID=882626 RepID=A0A975DGH0_9GAMM|nr:thiopurine S-methyltransferase [Pseudoalteromonas xiamenensis]QTH70672.1 thiopurine S-methyltransferase [Pseudoalteromonas xiamenensis]